MARNLNISGMGDNDEGALTAEQQSQLNQFKVMYLKLNLKAMV